MLERHCITPNGPVCYWLSQPWKPERPVLVFLHGLTGNHTMFQAQISHFAPNYNILTWDAPAHGKSRPYANFSIAKGVEVLKQILEENTITSAVLVGQSLGGYFAQSFLDRYPDMVQGFVGIDTTPYGLHYYSGLDCFLLRQIELLASLYPLRVIKKAIAKQVSVTDSGYVLMMEMLKPYEKKELCHLMGLGYAGFLEDNRETTIHCPALLLLGEQDRTGKVRQYVTTWAKRSKIPLVLIPRAAHNANVDNPEVVNAAIEDFLATRFGK